MVGIHFVTSIVVGLLIGYFLDKYLGTEPWLLIIFFFLGVLAGFFDMFKYAFRPDEPDPLEDPYGPDRPDKPDIIDKPDIANKDKNGPAV